MFKILRTEWLKIRSYWAFWLVMFMTAAAYPSINYLFWTEFKDLSKRKGAGKMLQMLLGNPFELPETFHTTAFFSSVFVLIPAIVVIMLITNEYTYKTNRQNIIDGWSRNSFLLGKFFNVLIISALVSILFTAISFIIGNIATTKEVANPWSQTRYIWLFALQTFYQLSIAFLIGFLIKRSFIALGVFVFYYIILENALIGIAKVNKLNYADYLPLEISDKIIPPPAFFGRLDEATYKANLAAIDTHVVYTIILTFVVWGICYLVNRHRDL
jgi:ABC-type transport system involved in multi-copper enzyme maturation permease subunit